jgi:Lrp/AsnC family transcriptional regulator for asnA, asnC and gidA
MAHAVDETDRRIIALLQADGRRPNVDMAAELGLAEGTIRKRLDRLLTDGVIRITAIVDPPRVGLDTSAVITVQVDLSLVDDIVRQLAALPAVQSVSVTTGNWDLILEAVFPTDRQLLGFLKDQVSTIPGVRRTETSHVLRRVKHVGNWELAPGVGPTVSADVDVEMLRQFEIFGDMTGADLDKVARQCRVRTLEAGARIYHENDVAEDLYLVEQGRVALLMEVGQGRQAMVGSVGRREICGCAAMLTPPVQTETARCMERTTAITIPAAALRDLCLRDCTSCQSVMVQIAVQVSTQLKDVRFQLTHMLKGADEADRPGQASSG